MTSPGVRDAEPGAGPGATRAGAVMSPAAVVWRSLPLQAAFNPQTLQGAGFAHALLPQLRRVHGSAAARRAAALAGAFNANPYLATFAIGAVAATEGAQPESRIDRFLALVRGPLGSLGDSLFWGAARPAALLPAAVAVVAGAPWWLAVAALVPYNVLAFAARVVGARSGLERGLDVAAALGDSWIRRAPAAIRRAGAAAIGLAAGWLLAAGGGPGAASLGLSLAPGLGQPAHWAATAAAFAAAGALFTLWPRRLGWGLALAVGWVALAGIARWTA